MNATENLHIESSGQGTDLVGYCMNPNSHRWNPSRLRLDYCLGDQRGLQHLCCFYIVF
jgi:hypothetical protein